MNKDTIDKLLEPFAPSAIEENVHRPGLPAYAKNIFIGSCLCAEVAIITITKYNSHLLPQSGLCTLLGSIIAGSVIGATLTYFSHDSREI